MNNHSASLINILSEYVQQTSELGMYMFKVLINSLWKLPQQHIPSYFLNTDYFSPWFRHFWFMQHLRLPLDLILIEIERIQLTLTMLFSKYSCWDLKGRWQTTCNKFFSSAVWSTVLLPCCLMHIFLVSYNPITETSQPKPKGDLCTTGASHTHQQTICNI